MIRNYLKTAWRSLHSNKFSSLINIGGLSVGMAVAMLIGLWVYDELSYNKYYQHYDRVAQVMVNANYDGTINTIASNPLPLANELRTTYGNNFKYVVESTASEQHIISSGDKQFTPTGRFMGHEAPEMLSLHMISGTRTGLNDPSSVLLSASLAQKLFGDTDPLNKMVKFDNKTILKISGIYQDQPDNTEFKDMAFIAPFEMYLSANPWAANARDNWNNQFVSIYIQLTENADIDRVSAQIKNSKLSHLTGAKAARKPAVFLHPMSRWHLYSKFENGVIVRSDELKYVWFYGTIGIFVLLLACINFMNLSTARSEKRAKEVGVRKVIGSGRNQLIGQFYCESLLIVLFSFILSLVLVQLSLPWFNNVAGKAITIPITNLFFWLAGILIILITGILAGSYPALYLSSFKPIRVLKGSFRMGRYAALPRRVLVVLQFTVSIALIMGTIVVYRQVKYAQERPVGYTRNNLLSVTLPTELQTNYGVLNNELLHSGAVIGVAASSSPVTSIWSTSNDFAWQGSDPNVKQDFGLISVDRTYGKTIGWQFTAGNDFSPASTSDSSALIINESAVKQMGLKEPVGAVIRHEGKNYLVLGVVKDMVMESPFKPASPIFFILKGYRYAMFLKLDPHRNPAEAIAKIAAIFKKLAPSTALDYKFVDDQYAAKFAAEVRIGNLAGCFAALSILISCLGLTGMASFITEQRVKEIGVRKILGASVFNLWIALSKDFVMLVMIAFSIATPIAWHFMHIWLQNYSYRIDLSWWIFALSGFGAMLITIITVSYQSIKAALANPVKSLRSE